VEDDLAIGWIYLKYLHQQGIFNGGKARILDVGCQNLYDVPEDEGFDFAREVGAAAPEDELRAALHELAARSPYPSGSGERVYFQELAALCGLDYIAYDIFPGKHIVIFDLNRESAPDAHRDRFDCVLNFGTTEHVFNQYNAFKVIHDVTRPGGHIFHQVPTVGYTNHGYWTYSPRTLLELAKANGYQTKAFWITGPQGNTPFNELAAAPELMWDPVLPENVQTAWPTCPVPHGLINGIFQKTAPRPFRLPLDTTTSNELPESELAQLYGRS
jgi:SAM-dependent methyltransferase